MYTVNLSLVGINNETYFIFYRQHPGSLRIDAAKRGFGGKTWPSDCEEV